MPWSGDKDYITRAHRGHYLAKGVNIKDMFAELMGKASGLCKGGSMHIANVDKGMLGANGIGTLAVPFGQIAAVSTAYGPVTITGQSQPSIGDVTADIGGSAITSAVTGNVSKAIASLART